MACSAYGFTGATKGFLSCVPIAASVTATGRLMIAKTKALVEELVPGSRVVYGDSVAGYTPCIVRSQGFVNVTTFDRLAEEYGNGVWQPMDRPGKESCELFGVDVWSDGGWTHMDRVIRHRAGKPMVRIVTHTGVVDVTEDHSLLLWDGTPVSPRNIGIGNMLLHSPMPKLFGGDAVETLGVEEAQVRGFFFGDGSAGVYTCASGVKSSWALNNADLELLQSYKRLCENAFPDFGWSILPTMESSGVYKLVPSGGYGKIQAFAAKFRDSMYCGSSKVIPANVLNAQHEVRAAFWRGMYDADGDKDIHGYKRIDQKSQLSAACIFLLAESLGYKASLNTRIDKPDIYRVTMTTSTQRKNPLAVKKVHPVDFGADQYVYDVTTANHHFHAGVGRLVVHNTDSVMCILNVGEERRHDMRAHFEKAGWLADTISKTFPPPVELEFEKTYYPYLLFSKKRYAGLMFTTPDKPDYIDVKGLQLVRRDNCPLVKDVSTAILNKIMYERSVEAAVAEAKAAIVRVLQNSEALEKFIVSKALRSDYKNNAQPHVFVANKILRRTGMAVPSGARVPFVIVRDDANPKALIAERAEDPEHVRANGIKLDVQYYITHQLMSPITTLLELMVKDVRKEVLDEEPIKSLMRARENQENNQLEITSFFKRKRDTTG